MEQAAWVVTDDGCRLWVAPAGRGQPVVLCHGGPGLWDYLGPVADMLVDLATVYRWDQRGCGRSTRMGPYSVGRCLDDLEALRRHFAIDRMALVGHSWGAQLALAYALRHPGRVSRLVYASGVGLGWAWKGPHAAVSTQRLGPARRARVDELSGRERTAAEDRELAVLLWSADFADQARALELAETLATPWFPINYECYRRINDELERTWEEAELVEACRSLPVPALILDGAEDPRPRWAVDSLAAALPDATRVTLPGAGHLPWLERPAEFRAALRDFLGQA